MPDSLSRRDAVKRLGLAGAGVLVGARLHRFAPPGFRVAGHDAEALVSAVSNDTVRLTVRSIEPGAPPVTETGALARDPIGTAVGGMRDAVLPWRVRAGDLTVEITDGPPAIRVLDRSGALVQRLGLDAQAPAVSFSLGNGPILGMGEGGPQFDRRGSKDPMINGQGGYALATHGTRAPIQWLIGTGGWALFIHQPYGALDLTGDRGVFAPTDGGTLPLDVFVVASRDPETIMREYARITGLAELPPRWALGYQQSHRTLAGRAEVMSVARTMREKRLPCDTLIYLGTDFCPAGWNTHNGEFTWHPVNFPDPGPMIEELHAEHFKVVLHVVVEGHTLTGRVSDPCSAPPLPSGRTPDGRWPPDRQVSCYWPAHEPAVRLGVDGWWPDQGDGFDGPSRFNRHRMYWEGMQRYRPDQRPYALHRNASAGVQRFGEFIWSGDVRSRWETLATHVSVAINTGLSGLPYWGTDIGGFIPTSEFTGELFVRWFQFGAFCPLFRAHGRNWHLRLPWGWDGGDGGPPESGDWKPDPAELHNASVEPICRKYMELRYRLLPYLYTAVRETHDTGLPLMRALWLHYPDDANAVSRGDEYCWGRDMLVAPVVERAATSRTLYLPRGRWWDYWTNEPLDGGREIRRDVDLSTTPLYVRAGAVIPHGPLKQYVEEPVDAPVTLVVYPGADGQSWLYDDDGETFAFRNGAFTRVAFDWNDAAHRLAISLAEGRAPAAGEPMRFDVRLAGSHDGRLVNFTGTRVDVVL